MIRPKEFTFTSKVATQDRKKDSEKRRNIPKHGSINSLPYLPVYNTRPCIIRTPIFDQIFHKQKFSEQKKNVNSSYNWRFAVVSFVTISNFLSLVITVIRYDRNVYLVSCFLNTLLNLFMDRNWKWFIGRLFNSSQ